MGSKFFPGARIGVDFFFIVSGYFMAVSIKKKNQFGVSQDLGAETQDFLFNKIGRFYPELIVSSVVGFFWMEFSWRDTSLAALLKRVVRLVWEPLLIRMAGFNDSKIIGTAWYISAMLLTMLVAYPICRKWFSISSCVLAPCIAIFIHGYFFRTGNNAVNLYNMIGLTYRGMLQAVADISLGVAFVPFVERLKKRKYTDVEKTIVTIIVIAIWLAAFANMAMSDKSSYSVVGVLQIAIGFCLTIANVDNLEKQLPKGLCYVLGKSSLLIYLSHDYIVKALKCFQIDCSSWKLTCLYVFILLLNSMVVAFVANRFRELFKKNDCIKIGSIFQSSPFCDLYRKIEIIRTPYRY